MTGYKKEGASATHVSPLLDVQGLEVHFGPQGDPVRAVDRIDLQVETGEIVALVGESGSGKSVSALALSGLVPTPAGRVVGGCIVLGGTDLSACTPAQMRAVRGSRIAYIFQEPATSLNPVFTVGWQIGEAIRLHRPRINRRVEIQRLLQAVGMKDPDRMARAYPHELSGGMQQRAMIAMALACEPDLLVADEPTTALDVTVQRQILDLLASLRRERGLSILLITHNLGIVADLADRVYVMQNGKIVESGDVRSVLQSPQHPYTRALLAAVPRLRRSSP